MVNNHMNTLFMMCIIIVLSETSMAEETPFGYTQNYPIALMNEFNCFQGCMLNKLSACDVLQGQYWVYEYRTGVL